MAEEAAQRVTVLGSASVDVQPEHDLESPSMTSSTGPGLPPLSTGQDAVTEQNSRVEKIESTLREVVRALNDLKGGRALVVDQGQSEGPVTVSRPEQDSQAVFEPDMPREYLVLAADTYLKRCECQPLPVFDERSFIESFYKRDPDVIYSVLAAASRFMDHGLAPTHSISYVQDYLTTARGLVMNRVTNGPVELSTLQSLCILSLVTFDLGMLENSQMLCSIVTSLTQCAQLEKNLQLQASPTIREERIRCYWAVGVLGAVFGPANPAPTRFNFTEIPLPRSPFAPPALVRKRLPRSSSPGTGTQQGCIKLLLEMSELWSKSMSYVQNCRQQTRQRCFPWQPESIYAQIMGALMDAGHTTAMMHKYRSIRLAAVDKEVLEQSRSYWIPWLTGRIMFHAIFCIINHPVLLTLQVRGYHNVADAFIHQTTVTISYHISWLMRYLNFMQTREFYVSNPAIIYCFGVAATIELQNSLSRQKGHEGGRRNFDNCVQFISSMQESWFYAGRLASRLNQLAQDMAAWSNRTTGESEHELVVDVSGIFDILSFHKSLVSSLDTTVSQTSLFGPSISHKSTVIGSQSSSLTPLARLVPQDKEPLNDSTLSVNAYFSGGQVFANGTQEGVEGNPLVDSNQELVLSLDDFFFGPLPGDNEIWSMSDANGFNIS